MSKTAHGLPDTPALRARDIEDKMHLLPNGCCIALWNSTFEIELLESGLTNTSRRILSSSGSIDQGLFDRAHVRLAELRTLGVIKP